MRAGDNRWHQAYREPLPAERDALTAHFRALKQMQPRSDSAYRMASEALDTAATMLGDTSLAGRLWGLRDHLESLR